MHLNIYPFFSACFLLRSFLEQACACGCRLLYLMAVPCRCAIYSLLCSVVTDLCYKFLNLLHTLYLPFFFLSLPTLLQRLQFQYTQCQQSHMISKEIPAKSQSLKREIRFVCSAFSALRSVAYWHVQPDRVSQIHTDLRRAQSKARVVLPHMLPCTVRTNCAHTKARSLW